MNSTQLRSPLKKFLTLTLVLLGFSELIFAEASAKMAFAPTPPMQTIAVSEVISYYSQRQQTQKLNPDEYNIRRLSELALDVFDVKFFSVPKHLTANKDKAEAVKLVNVAAQIIQAVEKKEDWSQISQANSDKLNANLELLNRVLSSSDYTWAWIQHQLGKKQEAKEILASKFETTFTNVMKLKQTYNHQASPLSESERLAKALKPLSTDAENKAREEQLKKMRTHVSTLPDVMIMT